MPLLDPSIQFLLVNKTHDRNSKVCTIEFFNTYLLIASRHIYQNFTTIDSSIQFKKHLLKYLDIYKEQLDFQITINDIKNPAITNYYNFIYKNLNSNNKTKKSTKIAGDYYITTDGFGIKFFRFNTIADGFHSWYLTDTPIAILSINLQDNQESDYWKQIKLEVDLMEASGYKLVLCVYEFCKDKSKLFKLIQDNQFSEIYYNSYNDEKLNCLKIFLDDYENKYKFNFEKLKGYFYFYIRMDDSFPTKERMIYKKIKKMPRVQISLYTGKLQDCFGNNTLQYTKPFAYCKNGFEYDYLRVYLSNVPLYDSENDFESFIPSKTTGLGIGYINKNDFLNWKKLRVQILFDDETKNNSLIEQYINFHDIHHIKTDLYVNNQLSLSKIRQRTLVSVNHMKKIIDERKLNETSNPNTLLKTLKNKIKSWLTYNAYKYSSIQHKRGNSFSPYETQIYTVYHACKRLMKIIDRDSKNYTNAKDERGIVFQVETGEGKSFIVCMIAAILAKLNNKTVHITSSNINLSIRDFEESFEFFKSLGIKSAVLLHSNELPLSIRKKFKISDEEIVSVSDIKDENKTENKNQDEKNQEKNQVIENKNQENKNKDQENKTQKDEKDDENNNKKETKKVEKSESQNKIKPQKNKNSEDDDDDDDDYDYDYDSENNDENDSNIGDKTEDQDSNKTANKKSNRKSIFDGNEDNYFKEGTQKADINIDQCYSDEHYNSELFKNSSRMNFSVCGLDEEGREPASKANVIFSTFFNFECFYLKMLELCPGSLESYFTKCSLLIDEADFILIDEIGNGTIVSRSMKSNSIEILKYVYDKKMKGLTYTETYDKIMKKEKWSICKVSDLSPSISSSSSSSSS